MATEAKTELKIIFLPFPTPGHLLAMADFAKICASLDGVECTVITTPANAHHFQSPTLTRTLPFPDVGLPSGIENFGSITDPEMTTKLFQAISMLREPTQALIRELLPVDCIISDMFYPWTSDFAHQIRVPRLVFQTSSIFSLCCMHSVKVNGSFKQVENDHEMVTLFTEPHKIEMKKSQLPEWVRKPNGFTHLMNAIKEAELKSYGILVNSCSEMEKEYEEYYNKVTGVKIWSIGPVSLQVDPVDEEVNQGKFVDVLRWLDQKKPNSVLFVSFGSLTRFPDIQNQEIAAGLEKSGHDFIWVVKKKKEENDEDEKWSIKEFEKKMKERNKGFLIIDGWAPQKLILEHEAIGGMVTHCGWNTIIEGISTAGVPLVTWPLFAEQFYNERLLVDVLKVGVAAGVNHWCNMNEPGIKEVIPRDKIEAAVRAAMGDDEMKRRARELREVAKKAVLQGGSSHASLMAFLDELKANRSNII